MYVDLFSSVWLWNEFPYRGQFGGHDTGIDLVAVTKDSEYWAVQCKCYREDTVIDKKAVDSFLSTSSRKFGTDEGEVAFSRRLWISTSNRWGKNAEEVLDRQDPPVSRLSVSDLETSGVDWNKLDEGIFGTAARVEKKKLRLHQEKAVEAVHEHFLTADRGKLIMACGTGKTFTALKIAEKETKERGLVLVLVPSIALMGQTLREWVANAERSISAICICSDATVSKKRSNEDLTGGSVMDLPLPASTDVGNIERQIVRFLRNQNTRMVVIFSTYQSIDVVSQVQKRFDWKFDLIVCDEAHRTTGVTLAGEDESSFVKVHDNAFLAADRRLYMTATPRLYSDSSKKKAELHDAVLCSMDDEAVYGKEVYRLGFGQAVNEGLLTDYKVLVLTLSDRDITPSVQRWVSGEDNSISMDDASKLIGCVNALSKQIVGDEGIIRETDPLPMRRAVAFCPKISASKEIAGYLNEIPERYISDLSPERQAQIVNVSAKHIDGSMNAAKRDALLSWLKEESYGCRVLTNVRCLSEGVDVPSLDAVMFLSARNSQVDVVQSVGRVMRRAPNKKYGYIIIPVVVPSDMPPEKVLDDNERFKVVWTVLNALRAHDDRFNATVNKIELNKKRPLNILIGGVPHDDEEEGSGWSAGDKTIQTRLQLQFTELQDTIYARMVVKVGERQYWEVWAKQVADIAEKQIARIRRLVQNTDVMEVFAEFVESLRENINPTIDEEQAIEMLSQHMITRPVFEALFENYSFAEHNPVSKSMQDMIRVLEENAFEKDTESLEKFYTSVRETAKGLDNAEARQSVIVKLYDNFFRTAFPKMVEQLGIVYTPVEVVDFIVHSVDDVLRKEFGRGLTDENVHILDPFTGTGTFVTRLLQSGLIDSGDLERKYREEIHANEIVLLAYYIAAVNIENAFHSLMPEGMSYQAFPGICLTDTFQMYEYREGEQIASEFFPKNSERVNVQKKTPITVIMSNPPYSMGQKSANDNAQNVKYPRLEKRIEETYVRATNVTQKRSLYDSYIKAFRWATDRLNEGVICFVSNGSWLDGNAMNGFRKHLERDFSSIYVFNLRGNQRTSGELSRKEGGKIFGSGSRTSVTITLLVKRQSSSKEKATIYYHDIGDYLSREEKLKIIKGFSSIVNLTMSLQILTPNEAGDWINLRSPIFDMYTPLGDKKGEMEDKAFFVPYYSGGLGTSRDSWCYNFSKENLMKNIQDSIDFYNSQVDKYATEKITNPKIDAKDVITYDSTRFSWSDGGKTDLERLKKYSFVASSVRIGMYRPYFKQQVYFNRELNERVLQIPKLFPTKNTKNLVICISGIGVTKEFTALITDLTPDLELVGKSQCFPLYYYEPSTKAAPGKVLDATQTSLFAAVAEEEQPYYTRKDGISDFIYHKAHSQYADDSITKEDIFYYVYGFLHSKEYRQTFANDLKKMLARIPLVANKEDFLAFSRAGRALADLHLHYETVEPYPADVSGVEFENLRVTKMKFITKGDKSRIQYNESIVISGIPEKAYEYIVNGKSAIEWIMERYAITIDKDSGIKNDPNDWADEVGNPRYILDLLLSLITVSLRTMEIVDQLPKVAFGE
ncbi:DEAD/DEAH box helicase family protein [Methanocorpusculum sp. MG]|uniref:DEAD/DEAH box helicase family protein n=1 Tax=Methanocorpusculum petauri TaxID=3002863 RepID=A0ABT4IDQ4_9EURY|nr:type ISP restriction/modification enzyme [Methanocorpusculum petauri]MCZ0859711.1 DEAD/DEAH box helicase family protein [Methanocorpusculum petauri]